MDEQITFQHLNPVWSIAAKVREEIPFGQGALETRRGTRKFHAGAKVYVAGAYSGIGAYTIIVVGHYRGKGYVTVSLRVEYITNFHVELVYSPAIITRINKISRSNGFMLWDGSSESKAQAEDHAKQLSDLSDKLYNIRLEKRAAALNAKDKPQE